MNICRRRNDENAMGDACECLQWGTQLETVPNRNAALQAFYKDVERCAIRVVR